MLSSLAYLTADLPGVGGVLKERPEDFLVEEQPLYQPSGQGEHLYLFIEKRGQATADVVRQLAKAFRVGRSDVGYAGLKDKLAITRQHFSIYLPDKSHDQELLEQLKAAPFTLLWADRHNNKLRRGHHGGNRFIIHLRQVDPASVVTARRIVDRLVAHGVPNYVGEQRFGQRQTNHVLGRLLIQEKWEEFLDLALGQPQEGDYASTHAARELFARGDVPAALELWPRHLRHERQALDALRQGRPPRQAVLAIDRQQRAFLVSALQSAAFNRVLHRRISDGLLDKLVEGDLAWKHDSRAVFAADAAAVEQENGPAGRVARLEVSPSGPMWGPEMTRPAGRVLQWEREALAELEVSEEDLAASPAAPAGLRRPMRVVLRDPQVSAGADGHGPYLRLAFELERGAFATVVLREIIKPPQDRGLEQDSEIDRDS